MSQDFDFGEDTGEVIGRGTWIDKLALDVLNRKDNLKGDHPEIIRTESGLGASGFPHIGSFADASRAYAFKLAIEDLGRKAEFLAFADDLDGFRKVPEGIPPELKEHLGKPVSMVPDPWGCHDSFGQHMSSLLNETIKEAGIEFTPVSAYNLYKTGKMAPQVRKILNKAELAGQIVYDTTGQEKYLEVLPYHAICENCGKLYTTQAMSFDDKKDLVEYHCRDVEIGGSLQEGCSHHGFANINKAEGKLNWKVEFAARWELQQVDFEAFGKDIFESVTCNDEVCKQILDYEPPTHARYEMFLDKGGSKISKSAGNVITPQVWYKYGSPQSLALLTYKRMAGSRNLAVEDIPNYMKEIDFLENVYFGKIKEGNQARKRKLKGLFEYCWHLNPPEKASIQVPYTLLVNLVAVAPKTETEREDFLSSRLEEYGYLRGESNFEDIKERIHYAENWVADFEQMEEVTIKLNDQQKSAIQSLIKILESAETADDIQTAIFESARNNDIQPRDFFKLLYNLLLNTDRGPKLGPYIHTIGNKQVIKTLKKNIS